MSVEAFSWPAFAAIGAMAGATWLMRLGGFWLMGHVPLTARMRRMLEALPGSVVVAIVLPVTVKAGAPAFLAIGATIAAMLACRNQFLALAVGVAALSLARALGF